MGERTEAIVQTEGGGWLLFEDPVRIVAARHLEGVAAAIDDVERLTRDGGYHAMGYVSYEAGAAFGLSVRPPSDADPPLVWFGLFDPKNVRQVDSLSQSGPGRTAPRPTATRAAASTRSGGHGTRFGGGTARRVVIAMVAPHPVRGGRYRASNRAARSFGMGPSRCIQDCPTTLPGGCPGRPLARAI